jgi:protein TonB
MIIIPLAATVDLPVPHRAVASYMAVANVLPLEVPAPRGSSTGPQRAAPVTAPSFISESDDVPAPPSGGAISTDSVPGIPTGVVGGIGSIDSIVTGTPPVAPPLPPPAQRSPVPVGGMISAPRKTVHVAPIYPDIARVARVEGTVILEAVINERGDIERLKVLRSVPLLDAAAIEAVSRWRYTPTTLNNVPVPVLMTITVTFSLRD